mmetsp:Transcript_34756/g.84095  ORF Transcript_34756/g.84095 Transcript_34756/m.84095 type:complete len:103 (-) Transcript_34756:297-605(-)
MSKKKILTKGSIILIDSTPFKRLLIKNYEQKLSTIFDNSLKLLALKLINAGLFFAKVTSRPGQNGRINGYVLEEKELVDFIRFKPRFRKLYMKLNTQNKEII